MKKNINDLYAVKPITLRTDLSYQELAVIVSKQPRLYEFVRCLYENKKYELYRLRGMDSDNFNFAMTILKRHYPETHLYKFVLAEKEPI